MQADVDGDGSLNYGEFVAVSVHLRRMANDEHLHKAFTFFDQNQNGFIEVDELRSALSDEDDGNNEAVISAIMHDVDTDKVSFRAALHMSIHGYVWMFNAFHSFLNRCYASVSEEYICVETWLNLEQA